jgi:hypothetical protein
MVFAELARNVSVRALLQSRLLDEAAAREPKGIFAKLAEACDK